jgi:hypothetical protein
MMSTRKAQPEDTNKPASPQKQPVDSGAEEGKIKNSKGPAPFTLPKESE